MSGGADDLDPTEAQDAVDIAKGHGEFVRPSQYPPAHFIVFRDRPGDRDRYTLERWEVGAVFGRFVTSSDDAANIVGHIPDGYAPTGKPVGQYMVEVRVHKSVGGT